MASTAELADEISRFLFGGQNSYGQPAEANRLLLDAMIALRGVPAPELARG